MSIQVVSEDLQSTDPSPTRISFEAGAILGGSKVIRECEPRLTVGGIYRQYLLECACGTLILRTVSRLARVVKTGENLKCKECRLLNFRNRTKRSERYWAFLRKRSHDYLLDRYTRYRDLYSVEDIDILTEKIASASGLTMSEPPIDREAFYLYDGEPALASTFGYLRESLQEEP